MIKRIILGWVTLLTVSANAQVQTQLVGDSVRIHSNTGNGELILENATKGVNGFLYNKGNGRTDFRKALTKVTDSLYLVGVDSLHLMPGGNTSVQSLTDGATITWNVANGTNGTVTLGATGRTLTITNPIAGQFYRLNVKQDATGSRTITTWPTGTLWASGVSPTLSTAGLSIDNVTLYYDGTNYIGSYQLFNRTNTNVSILSFDAQHAAATKTDHVLSGVPAGALLVLSTAYGAGGLNATVSSSPSLTWTKRADAQPTSGSGDAEIYTAVYTAGGSITVSSAWGIHAQSSICYVIINQETTLGGASATANNQSTPSLSITTTRANSLIIGNTSDWNAVDEATGPRAYTGTPTESQYYLNIGGYTSYQYYKQATSAASYTLGISAPTGQSSGTALLEIRGK